MTIPGNTINTPFDKTIKKSIKDFVKHYKKSDGGKKMSDEKKKDNSAIDETRAAESGSNFSKEAQENFDKNARGSEDIMDMYEQGAFDN